MEYRPAIALPDIDLDGANGSKVNPSDFAGHGLVMLFCPTDPEAAQEELIAYNALSDALVRNDAYLVAVSGPSTVDPASRISIAQDQRRAWEAIGGRINENNHNSPIEGAVLLFGRGGCLDQMWHGTGHAKEVRLALDDRM